jgi:quinoprotein glucose dehydrogenase
VWEHPIDANGHAIPITYQGKDGKQYVAIMAGGGGGFFGGALADSVMAFALGEGVARPEISAAPRPAPVTAQTAVVPKSGPFSPPTTLPDGPGKAIVQQSCGKQCHAIEIVTSHRMSAPEWKTMVDAMVARGATGSEDELKLVVDYLSTHFAR